MKWLLIILITALVPVLATTTVILAGTSSDIDLPWHVFGEGGVTLSSGGNVMLSGTLGQTAAGRSEGGIVSLNGGFWQSNTDNDPSRLQGVGGEVIRVNKLIVLIPCLALTLVITILGVILGLRHRRAS